MAEQRTTTVGLVGEAAGKLVDACADAVTAMAGFMRRGTVLLQQMTPLVDQAVFLVESTHRHLDAKTALMKEDASRAQASMTRLSYLEARMGEVLKWKSRSERSWRDNKAVPHRNKPVSEENATQQASSVKEDEGMHSSKGLSHTGLKDGLTKLHRS